MEQHKIIGQTEDYLLRVAAEAGDEEGINLCYQVFNKEYQVIEIQTSLLPQAMTYLKDLQSGYSKAKEDALKDMAASLEEDKKEGNVYNIKGD